LIPAYSQASGDQVLHGVNYASAAAGILDATGRNFVCNIHSSFRFWPEHYLKQPSFSFEEFTFVK